MFFNSSTFSMHLSDLVLLHIQFAKLSKRSGLFFFFRAAFDELSLLYVIDLQGFIHAAIFPLNFLGSLNLRLNKFSQTKSNQSVNNSDRHFYPEYLTERRLECYAQTLKCYQN